MECITNCTHEVVLDNNGEVILQDNQILIRNNTSRALFYVEITPELSEVFGFAITDKVTRQQLYNPQDIDATPTKCGKWTEKSTLKLIELYKKFEHKFISTTIKNDSVYNEISEELAAANMLYTAQQCKDKFKYLKMRYMKHKDALKRSGAAPSAFKFAEEMDAIFSNKPTVNPVAVCSSRRTHSEIDISDAELEEEQEVKRPKKTKTILSKGEAAEKRHREKMDMQQKMIDQTAQFQRDLLEKTSVMQQALIASHEKMMSRLLEKL